MKYFLLFLANLLFYTVLPVQMANSQARFEGSFVFEWLIEPSNKHRQMRVTAPVKYVDANGKSWDVPVGAIIDGASIPRPLWTFSGSPFVGNYRRASVIHDYFCESQTTGAEEIHRMFRDAMIVDGIGTIEAAIKHAAVVAYGKTIGTCGKPKPPVDAFLESFDKNSVTGFFPGLAMSEEFKSNLDFLNANQGSDQFAAMQIEQRREFADKIIVESNTKYPEMLQAMVEYNLDSNETTLAAMEVSIQAVNPTLEEIETHAYLAVASVPR